MARQRKHVFRHLVLLLAILVSRPAWSETPDILPPEPFAVELPAGAATLNAGDEALRVLLAKTRAGGDRVTASLPRARVGPGAWRVILSAWTEGTRDRPVARREAVLVVLPHGMVPVGVTASGAAPHVARDADGFIHMVWAGGARAGTREGAKYRRARVLPDGTTQIETDVENLAPHNGDETASPVVAAGGGTIHFAWYADGTIWYRSLRKSGPDWLWSDDIDTKVAGAQDEGPALAADEDTVYLLTSDGRFLASRDGARAWTAESVPFGNDQRVGTVSLTLDRAHRPLAAACVLLGEAAHPTGGKPDGARWTVRIARRTGTGAWQMSPGPFEGRPEWASADPPEEDVTCDSFRVEEDLGGALHAVWRGTPAGAAAAGARAYYAWRTPGGEWRPPELLARPDPILGLGKSFAAGLILDKDIAMPLIAMELHSGWRYRGIDVALQQFHDGQRRAAGLTISGFLRDAMTESEPAEALSAWSPDAVPTLFAAAGGHVWSDVVLTLSRHASASVIVWRHQDVTGWLKASGP